MFLGGHPSDLPSFLRDTFVEENASLNSQATNLIQDNFFREVPRSQLENSSIDGMVKSLRSRFSHYFSPQSRPVAL